MPNQTPSFNAPTGTAYHRYTLTPRRRFLRKWGQMVSELRALNDTAVEVFDSPMILDAIERLLGDAESLAVVMVEPKVYTLVPRPFA